MRSDRGKESSEKGGNGTAAGRGFLHHPRRGISDGNGRLFHPPGRMRRRVSVVRCQIHLEYPPLPRIRRRKGYRTGGGIRRSLCGDNRRRTSDAPAGPPDRRTEGQRSAGIPRNFGNASAARGIRLDMPLPETAGPSAGGVFQAADELKVVIGNAEDLLWAEQCAARAGKSCRLYLQPEWSRFAEAVRLITEYVKAHPQWKVSLQTHKFMEIP